MRIVHSSLVEAQLQPLHFSAPPLSCFVNVGLPGAAGSVSAISRGRQPCNALAMPVTPSPSNQDWTTTICRGLILGLIGVDVSRKP